MSTVQPVEESAEQMPDEFARLYERVGELGAQIGNGLPSPVEMRDLAMHWLDAWNGHDVEALLAVTTQDIVVQDPTALGLIARGRDEFQKFCKDFLYAFPDVHFDMAPQSYIGVDEPRVAVPWQMSATFTSEFAPPSAPRPIAPTGRRFVVDGIDIYEFREGRLCSWFLYYDAYTMIEQLGLAPALDSRMMRMMAPMQRIRAAIMRRQARREKKAE
jgi:steroid delta-isomerase-like uncharacterized protein